MRDAVGLPSPPHHFGGDVYWAEADGDGDDDVNERRPVCAADPSVRPQAPLIKDVNVRCFQTMYGSTYEGKMPLRIHQQIRNPPN